MNAKLTGLLTSTASGMLHERMSRGRMHDLLGEAAHVASSHGSFREHTGLSLSLFDNGFKHTGLSPSLFGNQLQACRPKSVSAWPWFRTCGPKSVSVRQPSSSTQGLSLSLLGHERARGIEKIPSQSMFCAPILPSLREACRLKGCCVKRAAARPPKRRARP